MVAGHRSVILQLRTRSLGEPAPLEPGIGAAFLPIVSFVTRTLQRLPSNTDYPRFFSGTNTQRFAFFSHSRAVLISVTRKTSRRRSSVGRLGVSYLFGSASSTRAE